jgi:phosphoribosyl 1,2-cyclic phosphodiesterase
MRIVFWGVRGSYPVPGPDTVRYGGHTSCVEVRDGNAVLILDAGTGLRALGHRLAAEQGDGPCHYHLVLSHVHWDHIQGLPFFEPAYLEGTRISIYAMRAAADELQHVIGGITRHEFFPVNLAAVPAQFEFHEVAPGVELRAGAFSLLPFALNHPFGAVGYRVSAAGASCAYVSDTAPFTDLLHKQHFLAGPESPTAEDRAQLADMEAALRRSLRGVHTVVYDTHFLPEEYARFPHYGHSTPEHAIDLCSGAGVRRLALFHHAPNHTDAIMDEVARTYAERGRNVGVEVVTAREGLTLAIGEEP